MNKTQFKKAVRILAKGCKTTDYLYANGAHCALGDLLHAAGVPDEELRSSSPSSEQEELLFVTYGITDDMQADIMGQNDNATTVCRRRKAVINYLKGCVSETQAAE